jgi:hypothetical protein
VKGEEKRRRRPLRAAHLQLLQIPWPRKFDNQKAAVVRFPRDCDRGPIPQLSFAGDLCPAQFIELGLLMVNPVEPTAGLPAGGCAWRVDFERA